jgi:hypothetical protein
MNINEFEMYSFLLVQLTVVVVVDSWYGALNFMYIWSENSSPESEAKDGAIGRQFQTFSPSKALQ